MSLSHRYRQLAALIEALEADGITVEEAEPLDNGGGRSPADGFRVQLSLELPADATMGGFGSDSVDVGGNRSLQPVGTHVPASEQLPDGGGGRSEGAVGDGSRARSDTSAVAGERTDATSGEHSAVDSREGGDDPTDSTVFEAEATGEGGPTETDSTAATNPTAGRATDDKTDRTADDETTDDETGDHDGGTGDEAVACTHPDCDRTFETERGMKIHRTKAHPLSELVDDGHGRTVHHDPSVLSRVYDEHDTFAEMTEALDVDVGAQAVRKQMIRHGIHEPGTGSSTDDAAPSDDDATGAERDDSETLDGAAGRTDGTDTPTTEADEHARDESETPRDEREADIDTDTDATSDEPMVSDRLPELDLPGSLSTTDLRTAVEEATTLYDVQRSLDLDRETTRNVLAEYDLLELVSGRAAALRDREELKTEISQRIRRRAT